MPRDISRRLTMLALLFVAAAVIILFSLPVTAAPRTQTTVPNLRMNADTTITITVAITDGQVVVVPIDLNIAAQNLRSETNVAIIAGVEQQPGIFIGVVPADPVSATFQLTDASGAVPTPAPTSSANESASSPAAVGGTHVANANSNLRAGPGTNFERIGRVPEGDTVTVVGQNDDGSWLQLDDGSWIAEFLVDPVDEDNPPPDDADPDDADNDADENTDEDTGAEAEEVTEDDAASDEPEATPTTLSNQAALAIYLVSIAEISAGASDAVTELQTLIQSPQPLNTAWRNDVSAQLDVLSTALDQYLALTPVSGYEDLHAEVTTVAVTCEAAVNYLVSGLENPSSIDPGTASESVQTCAAQATDLGVYLETIQ